MKIIKAKNILLIFLSVIASAEPVDPFKCCEDAFQKSEYEKAIMCYERVMPAVVGIASDAQLLRARLNNAEALLGSGNYVAGFKELDARLELRAPLEKPWQGGEVIGRTILVRAEQGLGDTFFFARYILLLKSLGANTVLLTQAPLKELLSQSKKLGKVITNGDSVPRFDDDVYMMSLPRYISRDIKNGRPVLKPTNVQTIPQVGKIIIPSAEKSREWRAKLPRNKFKIGICHRASQLPAGQVRTLERDMPLQLLTDQLKNIPGVAMYNLLSGFNDPVKKKDVTATTDPKDIVSDDVEIETFKKFDQQPFMDSAALIDECDLIVSVDTSISNLACAMKKTTIIALPKESDWRWGKGPVAKSAWHSTASLHWQITQGDWQPVAKSIAEEVRKRVAAKKLKSNL